MELTNPVPRQGARIWKKWLFCSVVVGGRPSFKMVLTATGEYAYRRPDDGVIVCPLSALRP